MRKIILGDGILSNEIHNITGWEFISRNKNSIDANFFSSWSYLLNDYDLIINCIAHTDTYSNDRNSHWCVNYKFVSELVDYCNIHNKKLVHISTDYVYTNSVENASESDIPIHGDNWYSYTKLLADAYIELRSKNYLICRGSHKPKPFPYEGAWIDQFGNFDYVDVMVELIVYLIESNSIGLYNVGTNKKSIFELARTTNTNVIPSVKPKIAPNDVTMDVRKLNSKTIKKEVVISAYNREYDWINNLNKNIKVTIYRKGDMLMDNEIKIEPNLGRDVHTFFYHLYNRYDSLSDITFFSQDYHIDHVYNYTDLMNGDFDMLNNNAIEKIEDACWFFNTQFNRSIECDNSGLPHDHGLNLKFLWERLFKTTSPNIFKFTPAGHFAITKEHARKIPKSVYKKIINILEKESKSPWEIERLETCIFINNYKDLINE